MLIRKLFRPAQLNSRQLIGAAVSLSLATFSVRPAWADDAAADVPQITVKGERRGDYKTDQASSAKYTAALLDTPQTLSVVPHQVIEDQSLLTMRDILSTLPGITFGAGEGGGGYGDSINLRGFAGSNDITVDGLRDSAQYTRSDPFNLEQVEVVSGASSVYAGAGSVGGTVNLVSKAPQIEKSFHRFSGSAATDDYGRITADLNQTFGARNAARLNVMWHENDVPGRDVERYERWGIAPAVTFGFGEATALTLSYLHQEDDNTPQYGVPTFRGRLLPEASQEAYYGYRNLDTQEIDTDILSAAVSHEFNDRFTLRNQTRAQQVDQLSVVDPPQGTFCLASTGLTPAGAACTATVTPFTGAQAISVTVAPGSYLPTGPRGNLRDTRNEALINQTDLISSFETGYIEHTMVTGLAISHETFTLQTGNLLRKADGSLLFLPQTPIGEPDSLYEGPQNFTLSSTTDGELDNQAIYAFDTLKLSEQWQLNAGLRYEHNDGTSLVTNFAALAAGGAVTQNPRGDNEDYLLSYRAGVVYKPVANGSVYLAYGNSNTPSKASVNGSCTTVVTSSAGLNCNLDPEEAVNYEIGTKWEVLDAKLSLTASIFRNERTNYRVNDPGNPDNPFQEERLDGSARVDGVLLGAGGLLTRKWGVYANYSYLDSEVLQGASERIASQGQDYTKGDPLLNVPKQALGLWTVYDLPRRVQVGYGVTYQSKVFVGQHSAANRDGALPTVSSYAVHRAMVRYGVSRNCDLQFNVNNIFDKEYLTRVRTSGEQAWATPGEGRQFVLMASYSF
jgi:catecholate siderophore receptor